jgi:hypothetical protein
MFMQTVNHQYFSGNSAEGFSGNQSSSFFRCLQLNEFSGNWSAVIEEPSADSAENSAENTIIFRSNPPP